MKGREDAARSAMRSTARHSSSHGKRKKKGEEKTDGACQCPRERKGRRKEKGGPALTFAPLFSNGRATGNLRERKRRGREEGDELTIQ